MCTNNNKQKRLEIEPFLHWYIIDMKFYLLSFRFFKTPPAAAVRIAPAKAKIPLMSDVSGDFAVFVVVVVVVVVLVRGFVVGVCRFVITKPVCVSPRIWLV